MSCILRLRTQCSLFVFGYKINDQIYNHLIIHRLEPHKRYSYENNFLGRGQKPKKSETLFSVLAPDFSLSNFPLQFTLSTVTSLGWFSFLSFFLQNLYILKLFVVKLFVNAVTE